MAPRDFQPFINLSFVYTIIVVLCANPQPSIQTAMFFSSCAFHALLHEYLSLPHVSLEKKGGGRRKLNKGMLGLMMSGGRSRIVRIHDKLGEFCSSSGSCD
jgi:hypothetical protein